MSRETVVVLPVIQWESGCVDVRQVAMKHKLSLFLQFDRKRLNTLHMSTASKVPDTARGKPPKNCVRNGK